MQSLDQLSAFVGAASHDPLSVWRHDDLKNSAGASIPDAIFDRNHAVLKADAQALWLRWYLEGVCNPNRYIEDISKTIVDIYIDTLKRINFLYSGTPLAERQQLAEKISHHILAEVDRQRRIERTFATQTQRQELVDNADGQPRCWMCGFLFSKPAKDKFLRKVQGVDLELPDLVDIFRPRGLNKRDVGIEVEHIVPVAGGGGGLDNLALSCGWCNISKGAKTSIYEARSRPPKSKFSLGSNEFHELPQPFWTVRLIAFRSRCEFVDGCEATVKNAELFISPAHPIGSMNPSNLRVFCTKHDPYAAYRFQGADSVRKVWQDRAR